MLDSNIVTATAAAVASAVTATSTTDPIAVVVFAIVSLVNAIFFFLKPKK